jgi:hypothetical protein
MFGWLFRNRDTTSGLAERLEKVERGLRSLSDDWEEFHDKVQRAVWRNAKRKDPPPTDTGDLPDVSPEQPARNNLRSVSGDPISDRIRMLRGRRLTVMPTKGDG